MKTSALGFHEGSMLLHASGRYPTLLEVILEAVQNAIDKNARDVRININQKTHNLTVRDDGDGTTQEEFEKSLESVGQTRKKADALGRFGLGLVSPVGKCEKYTFTSTPRNDPRGYMEWTFVHDEIREQKEVRIPLRTRPDFWFGTHSSSRNITAVNWRTEVKLEKYTKDRFVSKVTMESLAEGILTKFNEAMKRKKVFVHITITTEDGDRQTQEVRPRDFEGQRLPEAVVTNKNSGETIFRLYLARKTHKGSAGRVTVGETNNDYRISFAMFARSLPHECKLDEDTVMALTSGIFEGEILTSRARFHSGRRGFEANDALVGFAESIDTWFLQYGIEPFVDAKETKQAERYQNLGLRSLKVIEAIVKSAVGTHLLSVINSFSKGTIGTGHVNQPGKETPYTAVSTDGGREKGEPAGDSSAGRSEPSAEHKGHNPFVAVGPQGKKRVVVRNGSFGIQLVHEVLEGDKLYFLERRTGLLHLNVRHPLWIQCEEHNEKTVMRFQEHLILQAISIEAIPEDWREFARLGIEEINAPYVYLLINGDSLSGRIPTHQKRVPAVAPAKVSKKSKSLVISRSKLKS